MLPDGFCGVCYSPAHGLAITSVIKARVMKTPSECSYLCCCNIKGLGN